jgi:RIO kinase 1
MTGPGSLGKFLEADLAYTESQAGHERRRKAGRQQGQVTFDQATKAALAKLTATGALLELGDCISANRDASVFIGLRGLQAEEGWPVRFAVKSRFSVLKLNSTEGLFTSEIPFHGRASSAIAKCAKTEFRNLTRLYCHGIPSPCPLMVLKGVILMELICDGDSPAPSLHDAQLDLATYSQLYDQILIDIRRLFHRCGFVRADLTEHTIVVRNGRAIWTGAGRMIERENENASVVLRRGLASMTDFFRRVGVITAPLVRAFQFVIAETLEGGLHAVIDEMRSEAETMSAEEFVGRFAPHTLAGVTDAELARGLVRIPGEVAWQEEEEEVESDEEDDDSDEEDEEEEPRQEPIARKQFSRSEWKVKVREIKQANRERRQARKPQLEKREQKRRGHRNVK